MNLPTEGDSPAQGGGVPDPRTVRNSVGLSKPITMAHIARAAGVSQGAISSLLNDRDYGIRVSEKTRERVFKVCREMNYVPNDLRAVVRMYPELGDTCVLVSTKVPGGLANPFVARVAGAVIAAAPQRNITVSFYDEAREYTVDDESLPPPLKNGTGSKFIAIGAANASLCKITQRRGYPIIILGHETQLTGTTSIVHDYLAAARLAFGHFVKNSHKQVAIVGGPFGNPEPRLAELNSAIGHASVELGLSIAAQNIFQGDLSFEAGVAALDSLLARTPAPSAVFALSEAAACGLAARIHAKGLASKLSILALADHAAEIPSCIPVTTVVLPVEEMATTASQEADRQILVGVRPEAQKIILGVKLREQ